MILKGGVNLRRYKKPKYRRYRYNQGKRKKREKDKRKKSDDSMDSLDTFVIDFTKKGGVGPLLDLVIGKR